MIFNEFFDLKKPIKACTVQKNPPKYEIYTSLYLLIVAILKSPVI